MKKLTFLFLIILLPLMACAQSQSQDNLVDRVSRAVGVRLPDGYEAKVKEFVTRKKVFSDPRYSNPTELFIKNQMKSNWGIDRGHQLLFLWDAVYEQITGKCIYDCEDGNKKLIDEFEKLLEKLRACRMIFKVEYLISPRLQEIDTHIGELAKMNPTFTQEISSYKKKKEEYAIRVRSIKSKLPNFEQLGSTDMDSFEKEVESLYDDVHDLAFTVLEKLSAEAERKGKEATIGGIKNTVRFYNNYKKNPSNVRPGEIKQAKELTTSVFENCKKYNIDYKAELRKELGDDKKVAELLKFYGVE